MKPQSQYHLYLKYLFVLLFQLNAVFLFAQSNVTTEFNALLDSGKTEFKRKFLEQNYEHAIEVLEQAIKFEPENPEVHYFLGYAYSRLNAKDATEILKTNPELVVRASEEIEKTIQLSPKYTGEIVVLDTYSKLTAEWGALGMSYWFNDNKDSAIWAFNEGKRRGGFGDFYMSIVKEALNECSENAILITSGDNFTMPLYFLQIVEGYRKDVSLIDASLLNTIWYPQFLERKDIVKFDLPESYRDSIQYSEWKDSVITINNFSWTMKPSYGNEYIVRGDILLLALLEQNKFKRNVYFTSAFPEESQLSLSENLISLVLIDKINFNNEQKIDNASFLKLIQNILPLVYKVNRNCREELSFVTNLRIVIYYRLYDLKAANDTGEIMKILAFTDIYLNANDFPFNNNELENSYKIFHEH